MKHVFLFLFLSMCINTSIAQGLPPVFINEIHYWEGNNYADPFIEIAGPKYTNLDGWYLYMYNDNGEVSEVFSLYGIIDNEDGFAGALSFAPNLTPHIALIRENGTVAQFLSFLYSTTTAIEGPAEGLSSILIDVNEIGVEPTNHSLQQQEVFLNGLDFEGPNPHSPGDLNEGIPSHWSGDYSPVFTEVKVTCLSSGISVLSITFIDEYYDNDYSYSVDILDLMSWEDITPIPIGVDKFRITRNLGTAILEGQYFLAIATRHESDTGDAATALTYLALQSCGHPSDLDSDGVINESDNCPYTSNPNQEDVNNDGIGEACEDIAGVNTGSVGVGTEMPTAKLQVENGDIYVENIYRGIILRSFNGKCFRVRTDENGMLITREITCPE